MHFSIDRTVHTTAFDKPVVDHWLERKITQTAAGSTEKDRSDDRPLQRRACYRLSYIPLPLDIDSMYTNIGIDRRLVPPINHRQHAWSWLVSGSRGGWRITVFFELEKAYDTTPHGSMGLWRTSMASACEGTFPFLLQFFKKTDPLKSE